MTAKDSESETGKYYKLSRKAETRILRRMDEIWKQSIKSHRGRSARRLLNIRMVLKGFLMSGKLYQTSEDLYLILDPHNFDVWARVWSTELNVTKKTAREY